MQNPPQRLCIHSASPMEEHIGFARACRIGPYIAIAGTAAVNGDGSTHAPGDVYAQTQFCLQRSLAALQAAGGRAEDVIRTRILLCDIHQWEAAARAHGEIFAHIKPACTFMAVRGFVRAEWLVETEMDAIVLMAE